MKFITFILLNIGHFSSANVLLLPSAEIKYEKYAAICSGSEFICTTDYFVDLLKKHQTPQFDKLMNNVDLSSSQFVEELHNTIIKILNNEDLDQTQLSMLIELLKQTNAIKPTVLFKLVENELVRLQTLIANAGKPDKNAFVFVFKEMLSFAEANKIRTTILKIPLYVIQYASVPYKTNTFDFVRSIQKPLLNGFCGRSHLIYKITTAKYCTNAIPAEQPEMFTKGRDR